MAIDFTAADNDVVYGGAPVTAYPFAVTIPFTVDSNPGAAQALFYFGNSASATAYCHILINTDGTVGAYDRDVSSIVNTANTVATDGSVNVVTAIFDTGGAYATFNGRCRLKLNGGSSVSVDGAGTSGVASYDRLAFGRSMDSTPGGSCDCVVEQPVFFVLADNSYDFTDHDSVWNSGSPLDPSGLSLGEDHRWPFNNTSGAVGGTDTYIDDAVGASDLSTVGGSPVYVATIFTAGGGSVVPIIMQSL